MTLQTYFGVASIPIHLLAIQWSGFVPRFIDYISIIVEFCQRQRQNIQISTNFKCFSLSSSLSNIVNFSSGTTLSFIFGKSIGILWCASGQRRDDLNSKLMEYVFNYLTKVNHSEKREINYYKWNQSDRKLNVTSISILFLSFYKW